MLRLERHVLFEHVRTTHTHTHMHTAQPTSCANKVHIQAHLQRHVTHAWWIMQSTYTACWCRRKTPTLTNDVLCHAILLYDSSLGESAVYAGGHRTICVYVFLCVSKAAAIWEIDGRGRMETMSCGVFLLSALCFLSAPSLFSLILPSSFFPPKLKQIVNSFTFVFPPPPPRLSSLSLALSHCHSSILVFSSKVYHSPPPPSPQPTLSGLEKTFILTLNENFPHKRH